ncbi:unnamed protein product [Caenorhabditis bovis]|uniref:Uncharacterized protein n=1 Tax=Caenorhabditis bovis TaxID=2654633 RepID=A0A8S1EKQ9_9PELO|nr:unnamed protein product [Caenorhabditis bovis]
MKEASNLSEKTKELNRQLFKILILQTLIPLSTLLIPAGVIFVLPIFSIGIGEYANVPSIGAAIYPAIDAMIPIAMIRDYRQAVLCNRSTRGGRVSHNKSTTILNQFASSVN